MNLCISRLGTAFSSLLLCEFFLKKINNRFSRLLALKIFKMFADQIFADLLLKQIRLVQKQNHVRAFEDIQVDNAAKQSNGLSHPIIAIILPQKLIVSG